MVSIDNNKKENILNDNVDYSLISKNIVEMVDKFTSKNNLNKSVLIEGIVDPGVKSIDSLISKIYRKTHTELNNDFSLTDVKDILRCSIIVDNYNQVIPLIKELRKSLPSLNGDVSENEMGYIGIHVSLIIDGFNAEIQIATREAWYAKQAGEEIYEKWRDFNIQKEINNLSSILDKNKKEEQIKILFSQYTLKNSQLSYCKKMFNSLHKYTKLNKLKESINAILHLNEYNYKYNNKEKLHKYNIKIKDIKEDELFDYCNTYLTLAKEVKKDLIKYANNALEIVRNNENNNLNYLLTKKEKDFVILKKRYFSLLTKELKNKFNGSFEINKYISTLNKIANKLALNNLNSFNIDNLNISDNDDIIKLEEIVKRDIFYKEHFLSLINSNTN